MIIVKLKHEYNFTLEQINKNRRAYTQWKNNHPESRFCEEYEKIEVQLSNQLENLEMKIRNWEVSFELYKNICRITLGILMLIPFVKVLGILSKVLCKSEVFVFCKQNPEVISAYIFYAAICAAIGAWLIFSRKK